MGESERGAVAGVGEREREKMEKKKNRKNNETRLGERALVFNSQTSPPPRAVRAIIREIGYRRRGRRSRAVVVLFSPARKSAQGRRGAGEKRKGRNGNGSAK